MRLNDMTSSLPFFTNLISELQGFQKLANNSINNLTTEIIEEQNRLTSEPQRPVELHVAPEIQVQPKQTNNPLIESPTEEEDLRMALLKAQPYITRSKISYSNNEHPELGDGYLFNPGIFKDRLTKPKEDSDSYLNFMSSLQDYFIKKTPEEFADPWKYGEYIQSLKNQPPYPIPLLTEKFSIWLKSYNEVNNVDNGPMPIDLIKDKYELSMWEQLNFTSPQSWQEKQERLQENKEQARRDSQRWLNFVKQSIQFLQEMREYCMYNASSRTAYFDPKCMFQLSELQKFIITEVEKFSPEVIKKLIRHTDTDNNSKAANDFNNSIEFYLKTARSSVSDLDSKNLTINPANIKYIESFFVTEMADAKTSTNMGYLYTLLNSVHQAYVENYPSEGSIDDKERNHIARIISNLAECFNARNPDEAQKTFINKLKDFYTIEIENTNPLS
ncbi:MAG: hypothetical protein ACKO3R_03225 [bacterium]